MELRCTRDFDRERHLCEEMMAASTSPDGEPRIAEPS
jgi:hypothetical protein